MKSTFGDEARQGTRAHVKDRFHSGAVALATSAETDDEDGSRNHDGPWDTAQMRT